MNNALLCCAGNTNLTCDGYPQVFNYIMQPMRLFATWRLGASVMRSNCFTLFFFMPYLPFIFATLISYHRVAVCNKESCFQNLNWCGMDHRVEVRAVLPGLHIQLRSFDALVALTLKVSSRWFCLCPLNVIQQRFACVALNLRMVAGDVRVTLFISKETTGTSIVG